MKPVVLIIIGIVLLFSGLWGGSYLIYLFPPETDFCFAAFATAWIISIADGAMTGFGIYQLQSTDNRE
jgi:hypothetical protein